MRLIDADALKDYLKSLRHESKRFNDRGFAFAMCMLTENVCKDIDRQPTIEDRKVGKWLEPMKCSECGGEPWYSSNEKPYAFCPYCGARMEGNT